MTDSAHEIAGKLTEDEKWLVSQKHDGTSDFLTVAVHDVVVRHRLGKMSLLGPVWNDLGLSVLRILEAQDAP